THLAQGMGAGKTPEELPRFFQASTYKDARPGGWDPAERLKDMDLDSVAADVIYTTLGFRQFWLTDAALQRACSRVYTDGLAEYCAYAPKRLAGLALISLHDVDEGVKELERCAKRGLKGATIWASPPDDRPYSAPIYDPFWAAAQELAMPLSLHSITGMGAESRLAIKQPLDRYLRSTVPILRDLQSCVGGSAGARDASQPAQHHRHGSGEPSGDQAAPGSLSPLDRSVPRGPADPRRPDLLGRSRAISAPEVRVGRK